MKDNTLALGSLDNYLIIDKLEKGGYSTVYKVKHEKTNKLFAAKVVERYCKNEIEMNKKLSETQSPFINKYIDFLQGDLKLGKTEDFVSFFIFELCSKGSLNHYINSYYGGFEEKYCKVIFYKILQGIKVIHDNGICHRDIKADNILLDEEFNIKICDFGFSSYNKKIQDEYLGTRKYMAPEIVKGLTYDAIKADIFSLGVLLFNLRTSKFLFDLTKVNGTSLYDYVKDKNEIIWKIAESNGIRGLSNEFKKLFLKMVSFEPNERPNINDILEDEWFSEIRNLTKVDFEKLNQEVSNEFKKRERVFSLEKHD
jgi:serine/threonine protein kinase